MMRCDEVIDELSVPSGDHDPAALSEHLARCPACALAAQKLAALDRLWEASRPSEPSDEVWDAVWRRVVSSLDMSVPPGLESLERASASLNDQSAAVPSRRSAGSLAPSRRRGRNWVLVGWIGLAQAAAVLLAVGLAWHASNPSKWTQLAQTGDSSAAMPTVDVEEGRLVVIVIPAAGEKPTVVDRTPERMYLGVDDWYLVYNAVEALANPVVAMKE
jgi:hypothetical protein